MKKHGLVLFMLGILMVFFISETAALDLKQAAVPSFAKYQLSSTGNKQKAAELSAWVSNYYLHPKANLVPKKISEMDQFGLLCSTPKSFAGKAEVFLAEIFKENPDKLASWMKEVKTSKICSKRTIYQAIHDSNTQAGNLYLSNLAKRVNSKEAKYLKHLLASKPQDVMKKRINDIVLDELWAGFFATGNPKYVERILSVLAWNNPMYGTKQLTKKTLNKAIIIKVAKWSIRANAKQHKKIFNICENHMKSTSPKVKEQLQKLLYENDSMYFGDDIKDEMQLDKLTKNLRRKEHHNAN